MKKSVKIITLILFLFIGIKINVNADYAYCYYGYSPNDSDLVMQKKGLFQSEKKASVVLQIAYNSEKDDLKVPRFAGRYITTSDADFSDGYTREFSNEIKSQPIDCLTTRPTCFDKLPSVNLRNIQDNSGKLMCPDVYLYKEITSNSSNGSKWTISLEPDAESLYGKQYAKKYTISPDSTYSKIYNNTSTPENPGGESENKKVVTTCNYKYDNYQHTALLNGSGTVGFSILEDGTVTNTTAKGILSSQNLIFDDGKIYDLKCPKYIKFKEENIFGDTSKTYIKIGSASDYHAYYTGDINSAEDNKFALSYVSLKNSQSIIKISASANGYSASLGNQTITIDNINEVANTTPPKYLLYKNGKYYFNSYADKSADNLYVISSSFNALKDLPLNEIEATCEQLFGGGSGGFMTFLKDNVFKIIYIAVPIILLVLTTIDFSKVVFNDDKDGIKNAWKRFGKRAIAAILIYLTPTILIFIADVIGADDVNSCIKAIQNMDKSS